ncbi:unnamed protein product [Parascedosporium putredinis]|uniref:Zn(2)-C6 fungal-type domain-containing protein n=1 Tax=Parascedosporium putredinis TaxID=1442378 RepID=A0A9P1H0A0_9PEZI|nr:unnamed protein product [Parascedosporium putredinis]CAI7992578.1 unnamed protein product [Parascedosporium putredinis]
MRSLLTLAVVAISSAASVTALGSARVVNLCTKDVSLWSVGSQVSNPSRLKARGGSYSEKFSRDPVTGGRALKITIPTDGLWTGAPKPTLPSTLTVPRSESHLADRQDGWSPSPTIREALAMSHTTVPIKTAPAGAPAKRQRPNQADARLVRRKRAHAACQFCRARKAKCDNASPICGFCRHHGARCIYDEARDDQAPRSPPRDSHEDRRQHQELLGRFDRLEELLNSAAATRLESRHGQAACPISLASPNSILRSPAWQPESNASTSTPQSSENHLSRVPFYSPYTKSEAPLKWPIFKDVILQSDARIESFILEPQEAIIETNDAAHLSAAFSDFNGDRVSSNKGYIEYGIREDSLVRLCQAFLAHTHLRNPILEDSELISYAKAVTEHGLGWDSKTCLVVATKLLGSLQSPTANTPIRRTAADGFTQRSCLPASIRFDDYSQPDNELVFHLRGHFGEWSEWISRPFLYYYLHHHPEAPSTPEMLSIVRYEVDICADMIRRGLTRTVTATRGLSYVDPFGAPLFSSVSCYGMARFKPREIGDSCWSWQWSP